MMASRSSPFPHFRRTQLRSTHFAGPEKAFGVMKSLKGVWTRDGVRLCKHGPGLRALAALPADHTGWFTTGCNSSSSEFDSSLGLHMHTTLTQRQTQMCAHTQCGVRKR